MLRIVIIDAFGNQIIEKELNLVSRRNQISLKIPETKAGIYTIICSSESGVVRKKLIISD
jgi:hypothetical protein